MAALLEEREPDRIALVSSLSGEAADSLRDAICAFANDLPGRGRPGVAFIGVNDSGRPSGLEIQYALLRQLADIKSDGGILPPPTMTVERRILFGQAVAVVTVAPSVAPPVKHRGRVMVRIGPRRGIATSQDERILNERRQAGDRPYDVHPVPAASLDDLDIGLFQYLYLPRAFSPEVLAMNDRTLEQRLAACKMVASASNPTPTVLGLLVLGKKPRDFVPGQAIQFLRFQGEEVDSPILHDHLVEGPVHRMVEALDSLFVGFNRVAVEFAGLPLEVRKSDYSPVAFQQLARNALLHRSYEGTNSPVRVSWFSNRVEIQSPGGLFGAMTEEDLRTGASSDYRNPNLAEAFKVLDIIQKFGIGIRLAHRANADNGSPPISFEVKPSSIKATLFALAKP